MADPDTTQSNMALEASKLKEGQEVTWRWGKGTAGGKVDQIVEDGKAQVTSDKGNTITRIAREGDPAVRVSRKGNDVVKMAHELKPNE
ncbi:hypothetical protein PILCRDRAFT_12882 [Piloderma croceum F 1598]|uniref:Hypervirulence associated protein TUDOR domain-containing protein n=1 Tax=Piloderma croceum (strain F 1598) TaxID=765440 RepID=A0A0C3F8Q4_PILCF|nr:hypothetical protein PILCRDRAFT_12882 [Piloderma croceum F 1598]